MSNRQQFVSFNNVKSDTKEITCGVPQGSILGPLLFLIYINDLYDVCSSSVPILFADDTNLFFKDTDLSQLENIINSELENISLWLKANKLSLNIKKTHYIFFERGISKAQAIDLKIDNEFIDKVDKTKFLGVIIDSKLNWKSHISMIENKLCKSVGMVIKARQYLNMGALCTLYYSFIYPYLSYCNHVWGCAYATNLKRLFILQKKALRIMYGKNRSEPTDYMFSDLKIIKFPCINSYLIGNFMFKVYKGDVPDVISDFFCINNSVHKYFTRQNEHIHVHSAKSRLSQLSIRYKGAVIWNSILLKINPNLSDFTFLRTHKAAILNQML